MGNHLQPSGRKLPSPRGFGSGTYVCEGREDVSQLGGCRWVLTRLVAFLLSPPCNGLVSFCSLFLLGILAAWIPQPKNDRHQHLWRHPAGSDCRSRQAVRFSASPAAGLRAGSRTPLPPSPHHGSRPLPAPLAFPVGSGLLGWGLNARGGCATLAAPEPFAGRQALAGAAVVPLASPQWLASTGD